ncbi:MAG: HAD-IIB family hydrolase [Acutalibacteraceae bacterium]
MGLFEGCLLACDIDGTLISNGYINPANIEKIEFFMSEGGMFSLSTGRSASAVLPILKFIDKVSPCVVANGAMIYDFEHSKVVLQKCLPKNDFRIAKLAAALDDIGIEAHAGLDTYVLKRSRETDDHEEYEELNSIFIDYDKAAQIGCNKIIYLCRDQEQRERLKSIIEREKTDSDFVETTAEIDGRTRYYYEQLPKGVTKLTAIKKLCYIYGIKKGAFFAIGDYYNDLEMIENADIGAATAESPEAVKNKADYTTVPCACGAVADFIEFLTEKAKNRAFAVKI